MEKDSKYDIVIIGAGLTGLTAGFYLQRRGKRVLIVDKSSRTGGVIQSVREDGFLYETGPNTGVLSTAEAVMLFDDLADGCRIEKARPTANSRWIWKDDAWHPLPDSLRSAVTTPLFTMGDKFRILLEPLRRRGKDKNESLATLVRRRMGKSYLNYAVDPFISGIYAGDPEELVTRFALPKLYNLEQRYGSFILGGMAKAFGRKSPVEARVTKEIFSTSCGLSGLTDSMAAAIGAENILLSAADINIEKEGELYITKFTHQGKALSVKSDWVVTTCGCNSLSSLLAFAGSDELSDITNLEYAKVVQVIAGYREWRGLPLNGFGGLVPSVEKRKILGVLFTSSFLNNRAPEGGALLSIFLGGMRNPDYFDMDDEEIAAIATSEAGTMLQTGGAKPDLLKVFRYRHAIPQYGKSSGKRLEAINTLEAKYPGLLLAGNIRDGIGMADRIRQAVTIANMVP